MNDNKVKIIGLDESGNMGDKFIVFSLVELNEEKNNYLFIHNLLNSGFFFLPKRIVQGWDKKTKIKCCQTLLKSDLIDVNFYRINSFEQNKVLYDVFRFQSNLVFDIRKKLIEAYKSKKYEKNVMKEIISLLHPFRNSYIGPDTYMKSFSYMHILNRICSKTKICDFVKNPDSKINVLIDGGYRFTFWWRFIIENHENKEVLRNKLYINGIAKGDEFYLSMNIADLLAKSFREDPHFFFNKKVNDINYDFKSLHFSKEIFFNDLWNYTINH